MIKRFNKKADGFVLVVIVAVIAILITVNKVEAADLGPNPDVTFVSGGIGITTVGTGAQPTIIGQVKHSWHPADLVAELVLREDPSANFMLAKGFGDITVMGGVSYQTSANNLHPVLGIDYKRIMFRVSPYSTSSTVTGSCSGERRRRRCTPAATSTKNHTAVTLAIKFPIGSR